MARRGKAGKRGQREGDFYFDARRNRWRGRVMLGYKPDGAPNRITVYGSTRQEAATKLAQKVAGFSLGTLPPAHRVTMREYLSQWLEYKRRFAGREGQGLRPNSYRALEGPVRLYVLPVLGDKALQKIVPQDLKQLYAGIVNKGRAVRVAEIVHKALHGAFDAAVEEGILARNPCDQIKDAPRTTYRAEDRPRLAWEDVPRVLTAARETPFYMPVLLAMAAGLRRGEVLGLQWGDVEMSAGESGDVSGVLHIRRQWVKGEDGTWGTGPVKTRAGLRGVPVPPDVLEALAKHRAVAEALDGGTLDPDGFVNDGGDGRPIDPTDLSKGWAALRKKLDLNPDLHLHDLRGSFLTWLAERHVDPKTAAEIAGHGDVRVVWQFYQTVTKRLREEAGQALKGITGDGA